MQHWAMRLGITFFVAFAITARADTEAQRHTLAGLHGVHLQLELQGDDLESVGLGESVLRPEIEARLAAAGITLLDVAASTRTPGVPWLFLIVSTFQPPEAKDYAWSMRLQLEQRACLERESAICESVTTWDSRRFGSVSKRQMKTLHDDVGDLVNQFTSAWLATNPRR